MKKIGEFLKQLHSHGIYSEPDLQKEFEAETGMKAPWPTHTVGRTSCNTGPKGVVHLEGKDHELCSYGFQIAASLEETFAGSNEHSKFTGRGFAFRASLEAIQKQGL